MTLNIQKPKHHPPRILIYGTPKIGKSSFGALADNPVFQQTEDGLDAIPVDAFPLATTYNEVMTNIEALATQEHDKKTYVMDSLDWLEPLVWKETIARNPYSEKGKEIVSIDDYGFGKGYGHALSVWKEYLDAVNYLRREKGMAIVQIAHAQIKRFENPETDAYDRYEIKLQKSAAALISENSDIILFANYYVGIKKEEKNMSKEGRKRAIGGDRILYTEEKPAFIAGNRYGLPSEIPFDKNGDYWGVIASHVPFFNQS